MQADPQQRRRFFVGTSLFYRQLEEFQFRLVLCTSARVCVEAIPLLDVSPIKTDASLARLKGSIGLATLDRGTVALAGWSIPLALC